MRVRNLDITRVDGPDLSDADFDAFMALRGQFMQLRADVDPAEDRRRVEAWLRAPGCSVALGHDRAGKLQTLIEKNGRRVEFGGRSHVVWTSNHIFAAREYRKHPANTLGNFMNLGALVRRLGVRDGVSLIAALYPPSYITAIRAIPRLWIVGTGDAPPELDALAQHAAGEAFGESWLPGPRLIRMRTVPEDLVPRSAEGRALLARYETHNPSWREGYGVLVVTPLSVVNLAGIASQLALRTVTGKGR